MAKQATLELLAANAGPIKPVEFHEVFSGNYGVYGLHVVQERALPDARDGLKPVQRRILYTMYEGRYLASGPHRKSAEIVGKVLGERHPHGDASVYDAMARMAQPFSLRYPFIDGQGNWGASDGSPAAAYRYTEARLTALAEALISEDIARQTVPMIVTYKEDPRVLEPVYLPGHIPPVINPIDGIAVGISTAVPPHNLGEVLRACAAMLDAGILAEDGATFTTDQLIKYLPGPDYSEGGKVLLAGGGVRQYLESGRGRFVVRGTLVLEQLSPTKRALVITALPPVGRDRVINSIIDAINERKLEGLVAEPPLDETNEERTRIVLELKRDAKPDQVLENLWKHTMLEIGVSAQLYFLFADHLGTSATIPRQVGMVELLTYWLKHQLNVLERRLTFELAQYRARLAVVEALIIGAKNAQELVKIFQQAEGKAAAKEIICERFKLTQAQAEVIASMSLSQVTRPDASKYAEEKIGLVEKIGQHEELLSSRVKRIALLRQELKATEKKFGDARRTLIASGENTNDVTSGIESASQNNNQIQAHSSREPLALALYQDGTIKATPKDAFALKAKPVKADEGLVCLTEVAPHAFVLAVTNLGRVFGLPLERVPVVTRGGKGENINRYLKLENGERAVNVLALPGTAFEGIGDEQLYLVEFSAQGKVKKTPVAEYKTASTVPLSSLKLSEAGNDEVVAALLSNGKGEYLVTSSNGQTLRFSDEKLSAQGRVGQGQIAMALSKEAQVINAVFYLAGQIAPIAAQQQMNLDTTTKQTASNHYLLVLTAKGLMAKTKLQNYPLKNRATGGLITLALSTDDTIVATALVQETGPEQQIAVATSVGSQLINLANLPITAPGNKGRALTSFTRSTSGSLQSRIVALNLEQ